MRHCYLIIFLTCVSLSAVASESMFGSLTLTRGFNPENTEVKGYTGGSYSLSSEANRDDRNIACLGYSDLKPDHILILQDNFEYLAINVNSGGEDTTLLVMGSGKVLCGDDTGEKADASVEDSNWQSGTYKIWVGSIEPNRRWNYRLTLKTRSVRS